MLNSVGGVGSVGAWVGGWCELNFGIDPVGRVGPQNFGEGHKKMAGIEILVWVKHMILGTFVMIL